VEKHINYYPESQRGRSSASIFFKDEEKKSFYEASDMYVMASNVDSFGLAYLEGLG